MARDLNLAFSVIQRVGLGANSQMSTIPIRNFVLSATPRRPPALTHSRSFAAVARYLKTAARSFERSATATCTDRPPTPNTALPAGTFIRPVRARSLRLRRAAG